MRSTTTLHSWPDLIRLLCSREVFWQDARLALRSGRGEEAPPQQAADAAVGLRSHGPPADRLSVRSHGDVGS